MPESLERVSVAMAIPIDELLVQAGHRPRLRVDENPLVGEMSDVFRQLPQEEQETVLDYARWRWEGAGGADAGAAGDAAATAANSTRRGRAHSGRGVMRVKECGRRTQPARNATTSTEPPATRERIVSRSVSQK